MSVVMPAYQSERFVRAAIESVRSQSLEDWELIVVDDGSTDGTLPIARSGPDDPRVRVLQQAHGGASSARNHAISIARARLVAFLDADDLWPEHYLALMTSALRAAPEAVLAFGSWQYVDERATLLPQSVVPFGADARRAREELPRRNALVPSAVVVRTAALRRVGGFDATFEACGDWDLWLRLLPEGPFAPQPGATTLYRTHPGSITEDVDGVERGRLRLIEKHHGPASGPPATWPLPRRQAVGQALFAVALARLRQGDPATGKSELAEAITVWPEIVEEDEFFFELACANQPRGLRGSAYGLDLDEAAQLVRSLEPLPGGAATRARAAFAFAWVALSAGDRETARRFALEARGLPGLRGKSSALALAARATMPTRLARRIEGRRHGRPAGLKEDGCGSPSSS